MPFGIQNIGATCYLNSVLQALHSSQTRLKQYQGGCEFTQAVRDINVPKILEGIPQFTLGQTHDAHEALLAIIDKLEHTLGRDVFYGTCESKYITKTGSSIAKGQFGALMFNVGNEKTLEELYENSQKSEYIIDNGSGMFSCKEIMYTSFPKVLVCMFIEPKPIMLPCAFKGKKLNCIISHMGSKDAGHYIAIVYEGHETFIVDDDKIYKTYYLVLNLHFKSISFHLRYINNRLGLFIYPFDFISNF